MPDSVIRRFFRFCPFSVPITGGHQDEDGENVEVLGVLNRVLRVKKVEPAKRKRTSIAIDMVMQQFASQDNSVVVALGDVCCKATAVLKDTRDVGDGVGSEDAEFERLVGEEGEFDEQSVGDEGEAMRGGVEGGDKPSHWKQ